MTEEKSLTKTIQDKLGQVKGKLAEMRNDPEISPVKTINRSLK